ncbi:CRISPR-associated protein Cas1 [hydrothermal vent metagenome]|uniref:CRISPR-associated protein Cas1 n=1 Tax=hydrothermal vent metagenome TaxID=652676 RepID=A0A1W1BBY6_9ZZZZ
MAQNHTQYIFSMGTLSRKDNSIAFKNSKRIDYIPVEDLKELYCLGEVNLNSKFLDFIAKAGITMAHFILKSS